MLKKKLVFTGIVLFMFGLTTSSFAQMKCMEHSGGSGHKHNPSDSMVQDTQKRAVEEVGNKVCPVLNEKVDEKTKATYEYKGKIYNFCCPACIDEFKKDPKKYVEKVEEELQANVEDRASQPK